MVKVVHAADGEIEGHLDPSLAKAIGSVICIERRDDKKWKVAWMVTPSLLHGRAMDPVPPVDPHCY
jgi:hypothetical protein